VPLPVIDQDLPCVASLQHDFTEAPENTEERPRFAAAHLLKNGLKAIPRDIPWTEHSSVRRLKEKATLPIADEVPQDCCSVRMNVHVAASRFCFEMRLDTVLSLFPLLPNINDRAIGFDVFVYFDGLRHAHPCDKAEEIIFQWRATAARWVEQTR
jgi:hypothetical protein